MYNEKHVRGCEGRSGNGVWEKWGRGERERREMSGVWDGREGRSEGKAGVKRGWKKASLSSQAVPHTHVYVRVHVCTTEYVHAHQYGTSTKYKHILACVRSSHFPEAHRSNSSHYICSNIAYFNTWGWVTAGVIEWMLVHM